MSRRAADQRAVAAFKIAKKGRPVPSADDRRVMLADGRAVQDQVAFDIAPDQRFAFQQPYGSKGLTRDRQDEAGHVAPRRMLNMACKQALHQPWPRGVGEDRQDLCVDALEES
jgi:hypothetical protein